MSSLTAIVRTQGADASAPGMAVMKDTADNDGDGTGDPGTGEKQHGRERVVLLMHETRVLTASDATRLLLLLAREVHCIISFFGLLKSLNHTAYYFEVYTSGANQRSKSIRTRTL